MELPGEGDSMQESSPILLRRESEWVRPAVTAWHRRCLALRLCPMHLGRSISLSASLLTLFLGHSLGAQESLTPRDGEVFPEMAFPTLDGQDRMSLSDFRGQKVLLMQFASW